jgi:hypothetical protein
MGKRRGTILVCSAQARNSVAPVCGQSTITTLHLRQVVLEASTFRRSIWLTCSLPRERRHAADARASPAAQAPPNRDGLAGNHQAHPSSTVTAVREPRDRPLIGVTSRLTPFTQPFDE